MVRVEIDQEMCIGSGQCSFLAPAAFLQGVDGKASPAALLLPGSSELYEAVQSCPVGAIVATEVDAP
jgi:ferredoxin